MEKKVLKREIGIIGLGKMGGNVARRLTKKDWRVVGFNRTFEVSQKIKEENNGKFEASKTIQDLVSKLSTPRTIINLLPAGSPTDEMIEALLPLLDTNDIIVEMANSFYKDTQKRAGKVQNSGKKFIDVGISGGPGGALNGACLMIGGEKSLFEYLEPLFVDMAKQDAYEHFEGIGAGHFVKMVHNGIEYGMMQSIAEGFEIMKNAPFKLDLQKVTKIYNNGSVVESRLIGWLKDAFEKYGNNLEELSGAVGFNGEGEWTAKVAREMKIPAESIELAVEFRKKSQEKPSFTGKVLTGMRNAFGGHSIEKGKMT
jgi:6-phosphogluconate dehydrogenase